MNMDYQALYKSRNVKNRKLENSSILKQKRESKRQDLHLKNRNIDNQNTPDAVPKENIKQKIEKKRENLLQRLKEFKENKAKKKQEYMSSKKQPFITVAPKYVLDNSYERKLNQQPIVKSVKKQTAIKDPKHQNIPQFVVTHVPTSHRKVSPKIQKTLSDFKALTPKVLRFIPSKIDSRRNENPTTNSVTKSGKESKNAAKSNKRAILQDNNIRIVTPKVPLKNATGFAVPKKLTTYDKVKSSQKSVNFKFNEDGSFITSTNRKKPRNVNVLAINVSHIKSSEGNENLFDGISPIESDTPLKEKKNDDVEFEITKRASRRKSKIFTLPVPSLPAEVDKINTSYTIEEAPIITINNSSYTIEDHEKNDSKPEIGLPETKNSSYTIKAHGEDEVKKNTSYTIEVESEGNKYNSTARKSSIVFVEMDIAVPEIVLKPKRKSSLFKEENVPPTTLEVGEQNVASFYYNLIEKETDRLAGQCEIYKNYADVEDDNIRGLIIAAIGQTKILIDKKLTKFKVLVDHFAQNSDQKVRDSDLDGFWSIVMLDLENLNARFEKLKKLKENGWAEEECLPKVKKIKNGGVVKKKPNKCSSNMIADLIKKARLEKQKRKIESTQVVNVEILTPTKRRSYRIATTPRSNSKHRSSLCAGCTPKSSSSRKSILADNKRDAVKSILKTPGEKKKTKSVLFLDYTPDDHKIISSRKTKVIHTPKPKINFNVEEEEDDERTPRIMQQHLKRKRRSSTKFNKQSDSNTPVEPSNKRRSSNRRSSTINFVSSPVSSINKDALSKQKRTRRTGKVSFA